MSNGEDPIHEVLRVQAWRQGCFVPDDLATDLASEHHLRESVEWRFVVITHSCDLRCEVSREPFVELIAAEPIDSLDSLLLNGRNPRKLHLELESRDDKLCLAFDIHDRVRVEKERFRDYAPQAGAGLSPKNLRTLTAWVARRYTRSAFPDEFNRRLNSVDGKLERLWKGARARVISAVFVACSEKELQENQDYQIAVRLIAPKPTWDSASGSSDMDYVVERLEVILGECPGIEPRNVRALPEEDFTIAQTRLFKRLDLDYRSLPDDDAGVLPPDRLDQS